MVSSGLWPTPASSVLYLDHNIAVIICIKSKHKMANRVSNDQLEQLLEFLTEHPALAKGVGLGARSKETVDKLWNDLAENLNSNGLGSSKSGDRWKKYWADLKHKTKSRLAKRKRDALGTGGGPSSQNDLSEIEKKVLAIIGEQAVFGDTMHRVPVFDIEPLTPPDLSIIVSQEMIPNDVIETVPAGATVSVNSPSRRGQTCRILNTPECPVAIASTCAESQSQHDIPGPPRTGVESPVSRPILDRPRGRHIRTNSNIPSRIEPEWVMNLERCRVESEQKLADAALIMAEATRAQVEVAATQADMMRALVELVRAQHEHVRELLDRVLSREQPDKRPHTD